MSLVAEVTAQEIARLLTPIDAQNPAGLFDVENETYQAIDQEMVKLGGLQEPSIDWAYIEEASRQYLGQECKHLRIVAHLGVAWLRSQCWERWGFTVALLAGMVEAYWESAYGGSDLHAHAAYFIYALGDPVQRPGSQQCLFDTDTGLAVTALHRKHGIPRGTTQGVDGALDVSSGLLSPRSQPAHLVGDHRETPARLSSAGSLDGGVEGKQVGLFGDALNHLEYAVNFIAMLFQLMNHQAGLLHLAGEAINVLAGLLNQLVAAVGFLVGQVRGAGGELSVARHFLHTGRHLGYCAGNLGSFPLLAEGRAIVVVHCRQKLFGFLAQLAGRIGNASDYCPGHR